MIFRKDRRKGLPLFASILHVSDPELFRGDVRPARPPPAAAPRRAGDAGRARGRRSTGRGCRARSTRRGGRCSGARASSRLRSTTCTASSSASPGETAGPEEETPHDAHATPPDRRRLGAPSRLGPRADVQGHDAHLRRAVGRRRRVRRRASARLGLRARRARRHLPRQADRDGRRRSSAPRPAGGVFVPINPVLKAKQVAYILDDCSVRVLVTTPERLEAARATSSRRPRSSTSSCSAPRRSRRPASSCTPGTTFGGAGAACRSPTCIDVDMAAILYTSGSTGQAQGRRALAPQPAGRRRERQPVPRQRRGRRHPRRAAAQLRRRLQPAHDRVHGRRARRARQLPAAARRRPAVRQAPGHRAHLRAAAVDPADRAGVAGRGDAQPALLRQHRRAHAAGHARQAARDLPAAPSRS